MDGFEAEAHEALGVVEDGECMEAVVCEEPIVPMLATIKPAVSVAMKKEDVLHRAYDAKLKDPVKLEQELECMDLERWSKFVARLDTTRNIKADVNVTAMGILAMFPVVQE